MTENPLEKASPKSVDFDALNKEFTKLDKKHRYHLKHANKAFDRMWEIWGIVAKHEKEFLEWKRKQPESAEEAHL